MFENLNLHDVPRKDRPRERLFQLGGTSLTDAELLAIILRSGGKDISVTELSQQLIKKFGTLAKVVESEIETLHQVRNLGYAKCASIKAVYEIHQRISTPESIIFPRIQSPQDVYKLCAKDLENKKKEHFIVLSLDSRNTLISKDLVSIGTATEALVHTREVFRKAISCNAVSIVLVHNHPSLDPSPSDADLMITKKLAYAGKTLGIRVQDHIIIGGAIFTSLRKLNLLHL